LEDEGAKSGTRFVTDTAGNSLDLNVFRNLKRVDTSVSGARGGTKTPMRGHINSVPQSVLDALGF